MGRTNKAALVKRLQALSEQLGEQLNTEGTAAELKKHIADAERRLAERDAAKSGSSPTPPESNDGQSGDDSASTTGSDSGSGKPPQDDGDGTSLDEDDLAPYQVLRCFELPSRDGHGNRRYVPGTEARFDPEHADTKSLLAAGLIGEL